MTGERKGRNRGGRAAAASQDLQHVVAPVTQAPGMGLPGILVSHILIRAFGIKICIIMCFIS
jgi:hypothetical protein